MTPMDYPANAFGIPRIERQREMGLHSLERHRALDYPTSTTQFYRECTSQYPNMSQIDREREMNYVGSAATSDEQVMALTSIPTSQDLLDMRGRQINDL